jgi:FkbM family methyltransferase
MTDRITIAESDKFRRPSRMESFGASVGRAVANLPFRPLLKAAYQAALNIQTGGRGLKCSLPDGEVVRVLPACRFVSWNVAEYRAFKEAVAEGHTALDIGANVGCYALLLGQWVGPQGRVFAFEPASDTFSKLSKHIRLNSLSDRVTPVEAAVSDSTATATFLALDYHGMNRLAVEQDQVDQSRIVTVPTVTVDEFCAREKIAPDLIKIDVEGFELAVLRGARETIKGRGKELALFIEIHPTTWGEIGLSKSDLIEELDRQGLKALPLRDCDDMWAIEGECLRVVRK